MRHLRQIFTRLCCSALAIASGALFRFDAGLLGGVSINEIVLTTVGMGHNRTTRFFSHRLCRCPSVALVDNTGNLVALTPLSVAANSRECSDDRSSPYRLASRTADDSAKGNGAQARGN